MSFRMKVEDVFQFADKTVFVGPLETDEASIAGAAAVVRIDGIDYARIVVGGEVHTPTPNRDLWTTSRVGVDREMVRGHDVWLMSE